MKLRQSIPAAFDSVASRVPDAIALVMGDERLTYGELAARAAGVARYLQRQGVTRGDRVGLYSQRSIDAVTAMLGILAAGAAYVPFDPAYPAKLLEFVYHDCEPKLMLIDAALAADAAFWKGAGHALRAACDAAHPDSTATPSSAPTRLPDVGAEDVAYVMYTSGSTGHPKGVAIPHRGVVRLVIDNTFADMGPDQVHLQLAPLAFDASTFEIWGALLNGGRLAIVPAPFPSLDDVANAIARHGVTTLWLTAGLFHLMVEHRLQGLSPLKQLLAGGDVLSPQHIARAQRGLPHVQLINGYGPTENTTFTCCYRIPRGSDATLQPMVQPGAAPPAASQPGAVQPAAIPIGTPIAHTSVYVLDESRHPVPDGQEGELFTGGAGVGLGYWRRPELTAERFVADPFVAAEASKGASMYRTGDRVRRRADGNIEFLGRVDRQIKINGKRVELDEIEAVLRRSPLVADAAVTAPPVTEGARRVHAYVKFSQGENSLDALRTFVKGELPDYMFPATFTVLAELPLSPTGKVDRAKLLAPQGGHTAPLAADALAGPGTVPVGDVIASRLADIWCRILGRKSVGFDDNFFDLGGTSLQLIAVHATITTEMQRDVSVVDLFQYPHIRALAARLAGVAARLPGADAPAAGVTVAENSPPGSPRPR